MATERRDKLGRRIPEFDRSAASKKGAKTQKEKYGSDFHQRTGADGGRRGPGGGFAYLKAKDPEAHKELSSKAGKTGTKYFARLAEEDPEKLKELSQKGHEAQVASHKTNGSGRNPSVPRGRA